LREKVGIHKQLLDHLLQLGQPGASPKRVMTSFIKFLTLGFCSLRVLLEIG
jgi:hypothetical protein